MPPYIRRSLIALSIDDPKLADKAFDSWADAIVLDIVKHSAQDWQQTLQAQMPAAIAAASRGGAEVFVRLNAQTAYAELEATALQWAKEINGKSPTAQRMLKFSFNLIDDGLVGQQVFAGEATRLAYMTDEAQEGRLSFLEKREPDWAPYPWYY